MTRSTGRRVHCLRQKHPAGSGVQSFLSVILEIAKSPLCWSDLDWRGKNSYLEEIQGHGRAKLTTPLHRVREPDFEE
ncbi:Uncharacterized protein HZ326_2513 [Fusarium oxysporum f. sp. albedinis]|nr:Uncharacterized protein HZ326_2513 [Fusarium oxysporum f. sp. albedinis]